MKKPTLAEMYEAERRISDHKTTVIIELWDALEAIVEQGEAQFRAGDRHATFNRQTIQVAADMVAKYKHLTN